MASSLLTVYKRFPKFVLSAYHRPLTSHAACLHQWHFQNGKETRHKKQHFLVPNNRNANLFDGGTFLLQRNQMMQGSVTGKDSSLNAEEVPMSKLFTFMKSYVWPKDQGEIKKRVVASLSLLIGAKLINIQVPIMFKYAVDNLSALNFTTPEAAAYSTAFALVAGYGMARATSSGFNELRDAVFARVAQNSIRNMARSLFQQLHNLDMSFHLSRQTGAMSKAIDRGTRGINFVLRAFVFHIAPTIFEVSLVSGLLWYNCGGQFAACALSTLVAYATWTLSVTAWRTQFRIRMNKADNEMGNIAIDSLLNYETVKYFNNEKYEVERYDKVLAKYEDANLKTFHSLALLNFGQQFIFSCGLTGIMLLAVQGIKNGTLSVGDLVMVNGLLFQLSIPLNFLGSVYRDIRQSVIDMQTMFGLMNLKRDITNIPDAPQINLADNETTIAFENVSFGYTPSKTILDTMNFHVEPGQRIGIVGGSGSGKSTVIRLLYRLYDANAGRVLIGGKDISQVDLDSVRKMIAVVPQDTVLFHDTIFQNIKYGNLNATEEEVYEAAKMADVHDSIMNMPDGYQTIVGERGLKLSGGEKQRVAIARAIMKDPAIVLYDEATSSLDSITEEHILNAIKRITRQKTSIFIAHRNIVINPSVLMWRCNQELN